MTGPASSRDIKLLVSDIDGTVVRDDKSLSDAVVAAVRRVTDAGIAFALISARPPSGMFALAERLGVTGAMGAFNGGTVVMPDGRVLSASRLDPTLAGRALEALDVPGVAQWLFADGKWYATSTDNPYVPIERLAAGLEPTLDADWTTLLERVDKLVGLSDDHDALAALETKIAGLLGSVATVSRSHPYYLDITGPGADKGAGVAALAAAYDLPLAAIAVLGDQRNDVPMFKRAGLSVAMGQAPADVAAAADHVVRSNDDDGVADAIERFILPAIRT